MQQQIKSSQVTKRAVFFLFLLFIVFVVIFSRFVYIQAAKEVQGVDLEELVAKRWSQTNVIDGERGSIYDNNGDVLAEEIPSYTVIAILDDRFDSYVKDPKATAQSLSPILEMDAERLEELLSRDSVQVELGAQSKNMSYEKREEIEELKLEGILFREDPRRYYPKQIFASHIIGYTERDMSVARMGIESSLNEYLLEADGEITYQEDGRNRKLPDSDETIKEPKNGDDVYLTIDSRIQMAIEQTMNQVVEDFNPERVMAIVANAKTGEILGMSNRPSFNPNEYESIENYTNYTISSRFEPGSTMKIFTLAAAIEEGVYNGDETYESGSIEIVDKTVNDHNGGKGWGTITYDEGVRRSSNVAFSKIALEKLGPEKLYSYIDAFGFREPTGIDLPNEATGLIAEQYTIDAATTAFGQATAITPIQQVQAATAVANDGKMMKPYIIDRIVNPNTGKIDFENEPTIAGEPISEETANQVLGILETVVTEEDGTGRPYAIDGFDIAGKTGTAQIPSESGGYLSGENIYSFIGMAPKDDPEVIVYVAVDRPQLGAGQIGSEPVSMIFRNVMEQSLQYLDIAPSEDDEVSSVQKSIELEDYQGESLEEIKTTLTEKELQVIVIGEGDKITGQSHEPGTQLISGEKIIFLTDDELPLVPDISGWSLRDVYLLGKLLDIGMEVNGSGFVQEQTPEAGTEMDELSRMSVSLSKDNEDEENIGEVAEDNAVEEEEQEFFMD
ncbi:penicillin-binding protein [Salipaludibacillus sp. CF4.18]|uniref:penicillin-binding protein n=1 Tax=Salipaludibacillus sp. CF4.18 TaxID=3373081 RepID=UPI003EE4675C